MTADEMKRAWKRQTYVEYEGKRYFLRGVMAQWINGRVVTSAILLDVGTKNDTIIQARPEDIKEI